MDPATGEPWEPEGGDGLDELEVGLLISAHEEVAHPSGSVGSAASSTDVTLSSDNTPVTLATATLADAPAGRYVAVGAFYVNNAGSSFVFLETQSNGGSFTQRDRRDCRTTAGERTVFSQFDHTGGDLVVRLQGYYEASNATLGQAGDDRWGRDILVFRVAE